MNLMPNYIDNELLQVIRQLSAKHLIKSPHLTKTKLVKIYQNEIEIVYQVKNIVTKKAIRFVIPLESKDGLVATLILRSKNPNTVEFFDDFFSVKDSIPIYDVNELDKHFVFAAQHLDTYNDSLKAPFQKIKTTRNPKELDNNTLLLKVIQSVDLVDTQYKIRFKEDDTILLINKDFKFKLPFNDDLMFSDINGKYQFYSQAKARYHFELN